jgi:hypothetical protein
VIGVRKMRVTLPVPAELLADQGPTVGEMLDRFEEHRRWFDALPPAEQARVRAEQTRAAEVRAAEREAERCPHCGCHPDEHADG